MSTIYAYDSFKSGTSTSDLLSARWNTQTGISFTLQSTKGRFGGQSLEIAIGNNNTGGIWVKNLGTNQSTLCLHVPVKLNQTVTAKSAIFGFGDGANDQIAIVINPTVHTLSIVRGAFNGTVLATSTYSLPVGQYVVLEAKITFATGTGGSIELRANGPAIIGPTGSLNTSATGNAYANAVYAGCGMSTGGTGNSSNLSIEIEHFVVLDDFVGDKRFYVDLPNGASSTAWTPNASTNLSRIQEAQQDGDSTYNSSSNPGDIDYFSYAAMASGVTGIVAVITSIWARKDDAGTRSVRNKIKQSSTAANGATINVSSSYQEIIDTFYTDPVSGIAFVKSDVDSLVTGYEEVA